MLYYLRRKIIVLAYKIRYLSRSVEWLVFTHNPFAYISSCNRRPTGTTIAFLIFAQSAKNFKYLLNIIKNFMI